MPPPVLCPRRRRGVALYAIAALAALGARPGSAAGATPPAANVAPPAPSTAFFYAERPPVDLLVHFERVVVEPENVTADELRALREAGVAVHAYLSVGEVHRHRPWHVDVPRDAFLAANDAWGSDVVDLTREEWRRFLLERRIPELATRGFRGLFLDTLDSPLAAAGEGAARERQALALTTLVRGVRERFPALALLLNRGFEVLDDLAPMADGVTAESLFRGWDPVARRHVEVPEGDRRWLLERLRRARDEFGLPVTVIDYVPAADRELARETARRIADLGFTPWVATPDLGSVGVGLVEPIPRRVLLLYDGEERPRPEHSLAHRFLALPLEHLGFVVELRDVREELPERLSVRYAGVATWFGDARMARHGRYRRWLVERLDEGVRVAIVGNIGFVPDVPFLERLGLRRRTVPPREPLAIDRRDSMAGFETEVRARSRSLLPLEATAADVEVHLGLRDGGGREFPLVVTAPWGGLALDPYVLQPGPGERRLWILDPFRFLRESLGLPEIPAPDVTTENGRRLLMAAIDGDGAAERAALPGTPYASEVILRRILEVHRLPTTVSVIECEMAPDGLRAGESEDLERIAREIFRLPHVEPASHSYSHPSEWTLAEREPENPAHRLPVPGYRFDLEREIAGSAAYINARLAPPENPVRVVLWSGKATPSATALAIADRAGLWNFNGGDTRATYEHPSLTAVSPMGIEIDGLFQNYAPIMNENAFSGLWGAPSCGFEHAVATLEVTDTPRRLKPLEIHYHFHAGSKLAALRALERYYEWAARQETFPLFVSEYAARARDFRRVTIARALDGSWRLRGLEHLRTVRLSPALGWPDLERSPGVVAVRDLPQGRYVTFAGGGSAALHLADGPPRRPHLEQANAQVVSWEPRGSSVRFRVRGHLPVELTVAGTRGSCRLVYEDGEVEGVPLDGDRWRFRLEATEVRDGILLLE